MQYSLQPVVIKFAHCYPLLIRIIDLHSHLGVISSPGLAGADDGNSMKGLIMGWLRSVDGLNTHDEGFRHTLSGGVTTALILPGSADAMGTPALVFLFVSYIIKTLVCRWSGVRNKTPSYTRAIYNVSSPRTPSWSQWFDGRSWSTSQVETYEVSEPRICSPVRVFKFSSQS